MHPKPLGSVLTEPKVSVFIEAVIFTGVGDVTGNRVISGSKSLFTSINKGNKLVFKFILAPTEHTSV